MAAGRHAELKSSFNIKMIKNQSKSYVQQIDPCKRHGENLCVCHSVYTLHRRGHADFDQDPKRPGEQGDTDAHAYLGTL